jgi:DNA-repair protein XRCC2
LKLRGKEVVGVDRNREMNEKGQEQLQNWIKGDESGGDMLKRVWRVRPFLLPPPLHRVPLRVGNVLELVGPSPSAKTQILIQTAITCILPKHWNGIHYGGFDHLVLFIDLDSRFDINRFSQLLIYRIIEPYGNNFFPFLFIDDFNFMLVFIAIFVYVSV